MTTLKDSLENKDYLADVLLAYKIITAQAEALEKARAALLKIHNKGGQIGGDACSDIATETLAATDMEKVELK